jgi:recombination protein RecR
MLNKYPQGLEDFIKSFSKLPGVGEKTALRLLFHLLKWKPDDLHKLSESVLRLTEVRFCQQCGNFCDEKLCTVCTDSMRENSGILCVVENITDLWAIEKSGEFHGQYHVLGGVLNPLLGISPEKLSFKKLIERVKAQNFNHIILALNPSVEGEATCAYIKEILPHNVNVQRIGFGIPVGGSLEFLDSRTIAQALENRKDL